MAEMTIEQQQALALARARLRASQGSPAVEDNKAAPTPQTAPPDVFDKIYGSRDFRYLQGLAEPFYAVGEAVDRGMTALGVPEPFRPELAKIKRNIAPRIEEARRATGSEGTDWAHVAGMATNPFSVAAGLSPAAATIPGRIAQAGLYGGVGGGLTTVGEGNDFLATKGLQIGLGGLLGAAAQGAGEGVAAVGRGAWHAVEPWLRPDITKGRVYLEAAGDKADDIIALTRNPRQIVPGSAPTAGEAAVPAGRAEFSALQQKASEIAPSAYQLRADQQNAARISAVRSVSGDEQALKDAIKTRASNAATNYGAARDGVVQSDAALETLLKRPSMEKAFARAEQLAKENGQTFSATVGDVTEYPVQSLHYVKTAMDDLLQNPDRFGIGAAEARSMANTQRLFVNWLETKAPAYRAARTAYAQDSAPINQMQIGQYLENKLVPAISDEAKQRAGVYSQALRDAPGTIKRATGTQRFDDLSKALTPEQLSAVNSVRDELALSARNQQLAKAGAKAAPDISVDAPTVGNVLERGIMIYNNIVKRLEGRINKKLAADLAVEMLEPTKVGESLAAAKARQMRTNWLANQIQMRANSAYVVGGQVGAQQQQE